MDRDSRMVLERDYSLTIEHFAWQLKVESIYGGAKIPPSIQARWSFDVWKTLPPHERNLVSR